MQPSNIFIEGYFARLMYRSVYKMHEYALHGGGKVFLGADSPGARSRRSNCTRRFGAKPDKKIVDRSSGEPEFVEDTLHCHLDGLVVGVDRFWVVRPAGWVERLSGG